jgi:hypothetical protein
MKKNNNAINFILKRLLVSEASTRINFLNIFHSFLPKKYNYETNFFFIFLKLFIAIKIQYRNIYQVYCEEYVFGVYYWFTIKFIRYQL